MANFPENADWNPSSIRWQLIVVTYKIFRYAIPLFGIHFNFTRV